MMSAAVLVILGLFEGEIWNCLCVAEVRKIPAVEEKMFLLREGDERRASLREKMCDMTGDFILLFQFSFYRYLFSSSRSSLLNSTEKVAKL